MYVAPRAAGLLILPAFLAGPIFFAGPLVPKLRNGRDPGADLSSYQHSEPRLKQTFLSLFDRAKQREWRAYER